MDGRVVPISRGTVIPGSRRKVACRLGAVAELQQNAMREQLLDPISRNQSVRASDDPLLRRHRHDPE